METITVPNSVLKQQVLRIVSQQAPHHQTYPKKAPTLKWWNFCRRSIADPAQWRLPDKNKALIQIDRYIYFYLFYPH